MGNEPKRTYLRVQVTGGSGNGMAARVYCPLRGKYMRFDTCLECVRFERLVLPKDRRWLGIRCGAVTLIEDGELDDDL